MLNISDLRQRDVVYNGNMNIAVYSNCVIESPNDTVKYPLKKGQTCRMVALKVYDCSTVVTLDNGLEINSVCLDEVEGYEAPAMPTPERLKNYFEKRYRHIGLAYRGATLPKKIIIGGASFVVDMDNINVNDGDCFIIGRINNDVDVDLHVSDSTYVSRVHCFIAKEGNEYSIYDASLNGISVIK